MPAALPRAFFAGLFLALLSMPVFQMLTGLATIAPLDENRNRAPAPTLAMLATSPLLFFPKVQAWFQDHYGFRDVLIRAKAQIDFCLFEVSDRVHIGPDGWLYHRDTINTLLAMERLPDDQIEAAAKKVEELRDYLAARDIGLIFVTNQLADKFYPETVPQTAAPVKGRRKFDDFRRRLHTISGIEYLDTTDRLLELKRSVQVFYKTDLHWTEPAAFELAHDLINRIGILEKRPAPFRRAPLTIERRPFSGDVARFLPLFSPPSEEGVFIPWGITEANKGLVDRLIWIHRASPANPPFDWASSGDPSLDLLAPAVMLGDSFGDGLIRALNDYFKEFRHARTTEHKDNLSRVLESLPSDTRYFIFQMVEVRLPNWLALTLPAASHLPK
jgi:hypothetical protein